MTESDSAHAQEQDQQHEGGTYAEDLERREKIAAAVHTDYSGDPFAEKRDHTGQLAPQDGVSPDPLADEARAEAQGDPVMEAVAEREAQKE